MTPASQAQLAGVDPGVVPVDDALGHAPGHAPDHAPGDAFDDALDQAPGDASEHAPEHAPYYDKAAHYDDEIDRAAASRALGWHAEVAMAGGAIDVTVVDAAGRAVDGARVRITGYQRAHAAELLDVELATAGAGHYRGDVRERRGWHDLTVVADRGGARYVQHVAVEAR